ncbi:hypothetical protein ACI65C_000407 [Semiaphis heraclei]
MSRPVAAPRTGQADFGCGSKDEKTQASPNNDIGFIVDKVVLTDADKKLVLSNLWVPDNFYKFPLLEKNKKRGLWFQHKWLKEFNWLAYSNVKNGTFCKYCVLFARNGGIESQPLGNLVTVAFTNWKKAKEVYRVHSNLKYHSSSVLDSEQFLKIMEKKEPAIIERLDKNRALQIEENRKRIKPIIECIISCGKEELALRGSKDFGPINVDDDIRQGHFCALLKYRAKDDFLLTVLEGSEDISQDREQRRTTPKLWGILVQPRYSYL